MSQLNYTSQRKRVLENASAGDNYGEVMFADEFKTRQVELVSSDDLDGELVVYESNQYLPPDITQPAGQDNQYYPVGYTDMADQSFYDTSNPFVPSEDGVKNFNVQSTGSRWIFAAILNRTAGTVDSLTITIFDNQ